MRKGLITNRGKGRKKKSKSFDPNRDFVDQAVKDYIGNGGKITRIEDLSDDDFEKFIAHRDSVPPADEFLLGV